MSKTETRQPVVAGQFYAASAKELQKHIKALGADTGAAQGKEGRINALGCILPHAGYMYSGRVAAETTLRLVIRDTVILLGPNHTGNGEQFAIMTEGSWQTPLGNCPIDSGLAKAILKASTSLKEDSLAHRFEHSLEVELPFLQYARSGFSIIPIAFLSDDLKMLKETGKEIAESIIKSNRQDTTMLIASTDMTHYESQEEARRKDSEAIAAILELNEDKLAERIWRLKISMCGYAPVITLLSAAKHLGAKKASLIRYETSGDITGDTKSVVGYAGLIIE